MRRLKIVDDEVMTDRAGKALVFIIAFFGYAYVGYLAVADIRNLIQPPPACEAR